MPTTEPRQKLEEFAEIVRRNVPLAPYTALKIGGPAEMLVQPRTVEELASVVRACAREHIPTRVLGTGGNILVRDEGVRGVVLRLVEAPFIQISVDGQRIRAGAGVSLSTFVSEAARHGLAGLESLVGVAGTVGARRCRARCSASCCSKRSAYWGKRRTNSPGSGAWPSSLRATYSP